MIAENTPLILPLHQDLDRLREEAAGAAKIGTTGRGIGPAYEDKVGRRTVRVADLGDEATLDTRLDRLFAHHDALRRGLGRGADGPRRAARAAARGRAEDPAPTPRRSGACSTPSGARGPAHPVRGRAGRAARHRLRHLSLRDLVEHAGRDGRDRHRHGAGRDRLRARHRQGLHHPGRRGPVPGRADRRDRRAARRARPRVRHRDRAQAALRLVRRGAGAPDLHDQRRHAASR